MSDYSRWGLDETYQTSIDLSGHIFRIVEQVAADRVTPSGTGGIGVVQNKPKAGEAVTVRQFGTSKVQAGGTVNAGQFFKMASGGFATAIVSGDATPVTAVGRAKTAAASGFYFVGFINPWRIANVVSGSIVAAV